VLGLAVLMQRLLGDEFLSTIVTVKIYVLGNSMLIASGFSLKSFSTDTTLAVNVNILEVFVTPFFCLELFGTSLTSCHTIVFCLSMLMLPR
jgi:hypothetical protein